MSGSGSGAARSRHRGRGLAPRLWALLLLLQACTGETVTEVAVSEVEVFPPNVSAVVGESVRLDAVVRDDLGEELSRATPLWTSDDPSVAEVDATGLVQARSGGSTLVTASYEGVSGTSVVRVFAGPGIGASDESVEMLTAVGKGSPDPEVVSITNAGTGVLEGLSVDVRHPGGAPHWLTATIAGAAAPTSLTLTADADRSSAGVYHAVVAVTSSTPDVDPLEIDVTLRIADVDVRHSGGGTVVSEAGSSDSLTVSLGSAPDENVVLDVRSADAGEATVAPARLTFTPQNWSTPQKIGVTGVDDAAADGDQTTAVTVSVDASASDGAYDLVDDVVVSVRTTDDDAAGLIVTESDGSTVVTEAGATDAFTVALGSSPSNNVVLNVTSANLLEARVAPARLTFTPGNWSVAQTVTVTGVDDTANDGDQTTVVTVSVDAAASDEVYDAVPPRTVSVITTDDDEGGVVLTETGGATVVTEAGGTDVVDVALTAQPVFNVVLAVSSGDPSEVSVAPAQLTFTPANWSVPQAITVTGVDDAAVDGDQTTTVTVSVVAGASDDAYDAAPPQTVSVTTSDDDTGGIAVSETGGSTVVTEGGATDQIGVVLTAAPASQVVVDVTSANTLEVTVSPARLTFTPADWSAAQTVTVTAVDDAAADGNQVTSLTIAVDAAVSDDAFDAVPPQTVSVTSTDNDIAGVSLSETGGSTVVGEGGGTDELALVLTAAPASAVVVDVASADTLEATVSPDRITFTSSTWGVAQTVTVTGVDDLAVDGQQSTTVTAAVDPTASDDSYDGAAPQTVSVTTTDDDVAGVSLVETDDSTVVAEDGSTDQLLVALTAEPLSPVRLAVSSSDPLEVVASPSQLTFTTTDWSQDQVITLTGVDDLLVDGAQVSTIAVAVVAPFSDDAYDLVPDQVVSVTTRDDDG